MDEPFDIIINLVDEKNNKCVVNAHRSILVDSCEYFRGLLNTFKESTEKEIILHVPDVIICQDIIESFYGNKNRYTNMEDLVTYAKCVDYWGIDVDFKFLRTIPIKTIQDFENLLQVGNIIGCDDSLIKLVNKNLPSDYELTKLSKELVQRMIELEKKELYIISVKRRTINILNTRYRYPIHSITIHDDDVISIAVSFDGKYFASASTDKKIVIYDTETCQSVYKINTSSSIMKSIAFVPQSSNIAISHGNYININNFHTGNFCRTLDGHNGNIISDIAYICTSPNGKLIAGNHTIGDVNIWNPDTGELIVTLDKHNYHKYSCFSQNGIQFACNDHEKIFIYETKTFTLQFQISSNNFTLYPNAFCMESSRLIIINDRHIKIWDTMTNGQYLLLTFAEKINTAFFSKDGRYIIVNKESGIELHDTETGDIIKKIGNSEISGYERTQSYQRQLSCCFEIKTNLTKKLEKFLEE